MGLRKGANESLLVVALALAVLAQGLLPLAARARTVYVSNARSSVMAIDTETNTVKGEPIEVGWIPEQVAISRDGTRAYVPDSGKDWVAVIDTGTDEVLERIRVGLDPRGVAITPDGKFAYVTNYSSWSVSVIDTVAGEVVKTIGVEQAPYSIAMTPDGRRAYVANEWGKSVSVIDTITNTVIATLGMKGMPERISITPDGRRAYVLMVGWGAPDVVIIDTGTNEVVSEIDGNGSATRVAFTPDGTRAYVTEYWNGRVSVIDITTDKLIGTIEVGGTPFEVAVSPDGRRAYVSNPDSDSLSVIDTEENRVIESVGIGIEPNTVVVTPDGRRVFVTTGTLKDNLWVVDTATNDVTAVISLGRGAGADINVVPNQAPTAGFKIKPAAAGASTVFDASESSDPDGRVARYEWDFGDGSSEEVTEPTVSHVYRDAGKYTATLRVVDDEGGSTEGLVTDGATLYLNGGSLARTQRTLIIDPAPSMAPSGDSGAAREGTGECESYLRTPLVSVSHWRRIRKRLRLRLKASPGGYVLRSRRSTRFVLQVRGTRGERSRDLRKVIFYLDGRVVKTDRRAPYTLSADPGELAQGRHALKAAALSRYGTWRSLRLEFQVSDCGGAALSASLSSKRPRTHPDLELRARAGGAHLRSAKFRISRNLRIRTSGLEGRDVGAVELIGNGGIKKAGTLRLRGAGTSRFRGHGRGVVELFRGARLKVRLSLRGHRPVLSVSGIERYRASGVRVVLYGKRRRLLRNPDTCRRHHRFSVTLEAVGRGPATVGRSLKMCKKRPGSTFR